MGSDAKWIIGTLGPLILAVAGMLLAQHRGLEASFEARMDDLEARMDRIESDIREFRSLHLQAALQSADRDSE